MIVGANVSHLNLSHLNLREVISSHLGEVCASRLCTGRVNTGRGEGIANVSVLFSFLKEMNKSVAVAVCQALADWNITFF